MALQIPFPQNSNQILQPSRISPRRPTNTLNNSNHGYDSSLEASNMHSSYSSLHSSEPSINSSNKIISSNTSDKEADSIKSGVPLVEENQFQAQLSR